MRALAQNRHVIHSDNDRWLSVDSVQLLEGKHIVVDSLGAVAHHRRLEGDVVCLERAARGGVDVELRQNWSLELFEN